MWERLKLLLRDLFELPVTPVEARRRLVGRR